jgi:hypothetical protein
MKPSYDPRAREKTRPQISTNALAKYLVSPTSVQETILRDARFPRQFVTTPYQSAERALAEYLIDPRRDKEALDIVKKRLKRIIEAADSRPGAIKNAKLDRDLLNRFDLIENRLGLRSLGFEKPGSISPLRIEGVIVTVNVDLLIQPLVIEEENRIGGIIFRSSKEPDVESPKKEETRLKRLNIRHEMGKYVGSLIWTLLNSQFPERGRPSAAHCLSVDIQLGESISAGDDHLARHREIEAACRTIARLWNTVGPPE